MRNGRNLREQTPFEAYQLLNEPTRPNQTFEGAFAWMVHTQAYAEDEWKNVQQWNPPTSLTLAPGESKTYGLKFLIADSIRGMEQALASNHRPVAVGVRFRPAGKIYEFDPGPLILRRDDRVLVETERGPELGTIAVTARALGKPSESWVSPPSGLANSPGRRR